MTDLLLRKQQGKYANTELAVTARAQAAREWLMQQPYTDIAVLSHGCFLHFLTEDWEGSDSPQGKLASAASLKDNLSEANMSGVKGTSWGQTELRSFKFSPNEKDGAAFVETPESRERRGCATPLPGAQEQKRLREATLKTWTEWGILR